jgi:hypothetical protein
VADGPDAPFDVADISERLLVDGTVIWYKPEGFLADIVSVTDDEIIMKIRSVDGMLVVEKRRRMERFGDADKKTWQMYDEEKISGAVDWTIIREYEPFPDDPAQILIHENGVGILYYVQLLYQRIEEIQTQLRRESTSAKTKTFVSGFTGDRSKAENAMGDPNATAIFVPGNVTINSPYAAGVVTNLIAEKHDLLIQYDENVMDFITNEASQMSGISRRLMMSPMLQFVKGVRKRLTDIFELYKIKLAFDKVQVQTVEERTSEYNLLKQMRDDTVLTPDEFIKRATELA